MTDTADPPTAGHTSVPAPPCDPATLVMPAKNKARNLAWAGRGATVAVSRDALSTRTWRTYRPASAYLGAP